jgi:hypothetical protein
MPSPVPTPVAAALGLVPTVLGGVRRLPGKAVQLPVYAVSHALTSLGTARQGYDNLAERGERLLARLRGTSFDEVEDVVEDSLRGTPLARPYDAVEDALEDATEGVTQLVRKGTTRARSAAGSATRTVGGGLDKVADTVEDAAGKAGGSTTRTGGSATGKATGKVAGAADKARGTAAKAGGTAADKAADAAGTATAAVPEAEAPKGQPTPAATQPDSTRIDTAASSDVVETVERVSSTVGGTVLDHDDLPLPDYDHLTLGSLRGRMRSLDLPQLIQIRDYEKAHADRLPIVTMLDNRIAKLANDPTAPLSGSAPTDPVPAKAPAAKGTSKVSPATGGPTQNPPTAGVPTNPAQPRTGTAGTNPDSDA